MKQTLIAFLLLVAIASRGQDTTSEGILHLGRDTFTVTPCPMDTLKGILIWHCISEQNEGNCWDYGYWIGKCGPMGEMPLGDLTFIPGVWKRRFRMSDGEGKPYKTYEEECVNKGFRDSSWRKIPGRRVYAFIILRDKKPF